MPLRASFNRATIVARLLRLESEAGVALAQYLLAAYTPEGGQLARGRARDALDVPVISATVRDIAALADVGRTYGDGKLRDLAIEALLHYLDTLSQEKDK